MRLLFGALLALAIVAAARAEAPRDALPAEQDMEGCATLQMCLAILERGLDAEDSDRNYADAERIAEILKRFGDDAKRALLAHAVGKHGGWLNLSHQLLFHWHSWSDVDIPAVAKAIRQRKRASPLSFVLVEIGSPAAIASLVGDLDFSRTYLSDVALVRVGAKALAYLLEPLSRERTHRRAERIVNDMGEAAAEIAPAWADVAADESKGAALRIGALRGLAAMAETAPRARAVSPRLHGAYGASNRNIREAAFATLRLMKDPIVLPRLAHRCEPKGDPFRGTAGCVMEIAEYGADARAYGRLFVRFLSSPNGREQTAGSTAIGASGYREAIPLLYEKLGARDWRVVFEAIYDLGRLGAVNAEPRIRRLSQSHWLPQLRSFAKDVADALASPARRYDRVFPTYGEDVNSGLDAAAEPSIKEASACPSSNWIWDGKSFELPKGEYAILNANGERRFALDGGVLVGTSAGEFGGALSWVEPGRKARVLLDEAVTGIVPADSGGVIVLFETAMTLVGTPGDGFAVHVWRDKTKTWRLEEVARLPADGAALAKIGPDLYAAWSYGAAVVFSEAGVKGIAPCAIE